MPYPSSRRRKRERNREPHPRRDLQGDLRARSHPLHEGPPGAADVRLQRPHGRRPGRARRLLRGGRHPARSAHPPGAVARSPTGRRSPSCSSTASWSAAATSSPRCTRRASWPPRSASSRRPTRPRRRPSPRSRAPRPSRSATTSPSGFLAARRPRRSRVAAGGGNEQLAHRTEPALHAAAAAAPRASRETRAGTVAFAIASEDGRIRGVQPRRPVPLGEHDQGDAAGRRPARRRLPARSRPDEDELLRPMITRSSNNGARGHGLQGLGDAGLVDVARAARMTHFRPVGAVFETRITAADQARLFLRIDRLVPQAPPRLRPRRCSAGSSSRSAGGSPRSPSAAASTSSSRPGGARASPTRPRYWSGTAAGSRSRSSPATNRRSPTGRSPSPESPRACCTHDPHRRHPPSAAAVPGQRGRAARRGRGALRRQLPTLDGLDGIVSFGGEQDGVGPGAGARGGADRARPWRARSRSSASASARNCSRARRAGRTCACRRRLVTWAPLTVIAEDPVLGAIPPGAHAPALEPGRLRAAAGRRRGLRTAGRRPRGGLPRRPPRVGRPVPPRGRRRRARRLVRRVAVRCEPRRARPRRTPAPRTPAISPLRRRCRPRSSAPSRRRLRT